jgi:hypothetical protein
MIMWAIKNGHDYLDLGGDFSRRFDGIKLFKTEEIALKNIVEEGEDNERPVKIEIRMVK